MRQYFHPSPLALLGEVVKEEINQNRIHRGIRMVLENIPTDELDAPDTAASELDLPRVAGRNGLEALDRV